MESVTVICPWDPTLGRGGREVRCSVPAANRRHEPSINMPSHAMCLCKAITFLREISAQSAPQLYVFINSSSASGRAPEPPRTNRSGPEIKPASTASNGVGVLLRPRHLPPRAPAAPRRHLVQPQAAARCGENEDEPSSRGGGEAGRRRRADARFSQIRRRSGVGVARGGGGCGGTAVGAGARRVRAAVGRPPLHRRQNGGRVRRRASGRSAEHPLHAQHRLRNGEEFALCRASVGDLRQGGRDHHRMPKWQEISHGSSRTLLSWLHCRYRHRRRVLDMEGEWTTSQWPVTSSPSLNVAET